MVMDADVLSILVNSVATYVAADPARARRFRQTSPYFDLSAWQQIAEQGWLSTMAPEHRGGAGLGLVPAAAMAREFGRGALLEPFCAVGVMTVLCLAGADEASAVDRYLQSVMSGEIIAAVAWQGSAGDIEPEGCEVVGSSRENGVELNGVSRLVAVPMAHAFIVSARVGQGIGLFWVPRASAGLAAIDELGPDGSALAALRLDRVLVAPGDCLAGPEQGLAVLRRALDAALIANAAELVGIMEGALQLTLEYLRTRRQFGTLIGSFQALQHRTVDVWIELQLADAAVSAAANTFDDAAATSKARSIAASGAKARAARAALLLCNQALQFHGAMGFTDEYGLGLYLNRSLALAAWLGNATQHRRKFARLLAGVAS
jgi:alkylation response protein AidB-like acyl-CoA dehydrogenase